MKVPTTWDDWEGDPRGVAEVGYLRILVYVRQRLSTDWRVLVIQLDCKLVSIPISGRIYVWLVVWNISYLFHILGIIIPTDFHFFKGVETTNQNSV